MFRALRAGRSRRATIRLVVASTAAAVAVLGLTPSPASATTCSVKNRTSSVTYADLQTAVDSASPGDTLRVGGTCAAPVVVTKSLTLTNRYEDTNGVIQGVNLVRPLTVGRGATVVVRNLTVRDGGGVYPYSAHFIGGGIYNEGTLTLEGSTLVTGNTAHYGGGIFNAGGVLHVTGRTRIANNHGSGIDNYWGGVVVVSDRAVVTANDSNGIVNTKGTSDGTGSATLSIRGSARITGNTGIGVVNDCLSSLTVTRRAHVTGNLGGNIVAIGTSTFCQGYITS